MSAEKNMVEYTKALDDFMKARRRAELHHLWSVIAGKSKELLAYDEISKKVHATGLSSKGFQEIPIASIVGSVNRFEDFDRDFLPLFDEDIQRWAGVKAAMTSPNSTGLPPIKVYQIGDAYFVLDGNHRVSIAKQMGIETIEADVIGVRSRVRLSPEDSAEEIILKAEYADFLKETHLDELVSGVTLKLSFPGLYEILKEHIRVHRYYMGLEESREVPWEEAVLHWYQHVYLPIAATIQDQDILKEFPEHTETDLYIWVLDHQTYMKEEFGWSIRLEKAAADLVLTQGKRWSRAIRRLSHKVLAFLLPKPLKDFGTPGEWHVKKKFVQESLFSDILVAMSGSNESWIALEQAIIISKMERADLHGLVVEEVKREINQEDMARAFQERLDHANLSGRIIFSDGLIAERVCDRARVNDLVVLKLTHPPSSNIFRRIRSGLRLILRQSSRPVLLVQNRISPFNRLLLAYDGSPKGKEALFISSYFVKKHHKQLTVLVVDDDENQGKALLAEAEVEVGKDNMHGVFRQAGQKTSEIILQVAQEDSAEVIVIGGYGFSPVMEILFGSTIDGVLRGTNIPILVCQ